MDFPLKRKILPTLGDVKYKRIEVLSKFQQFKHSVIDRTKLLEDCKNLKQFERDVEDLEDWIKENLLLLSGNLLLENNKNIRSQIQRYQGLQAEVVAHSELISQLENQCVDFKQERHFASQKADQIFSKLKNNHCQLIEEFKIKIKFLDDVNSVQIFFREAEEIMELATNNIHDVSPGESVISFEHIKTLQTKMMFYEQVNETIKSRITSILSNAILLKKIDFENTLIEEKCNQVQLIWKQLENAFELRTDYLANAAEVFQFLSESEDTLSWVMDKASAASIADLGTDLDSVESLQKQHSKLMVDLLAIEDRIHILGSRCKILKSKHPLHIHSLISSLSKVEMYWETLRDKMDIRFKTLFKRSKFYKFIRDEYDLSGWIADMKHLINENDALKDISNPLNLLERHLDYEAEFKTHEDNIISTIEFGKSLKSLENLDISKIDICVNSLETNLFGLKKLLSSKRLFLEQSLEFHNFVKKCDCSILWLGFHISNFRNYDTGICLDSTNILLKNHEFFERSLIVYSDILNEILEEAKILSETKTLNYFILEKLELLKKMKVELDVASKDYRDKLENMIRINEFSLEASEYLTWISERFIVQDESKNIETERKLKKQLNLEKLLQINSFRFDEFIKGCNLFVLSIERLHDCISFINLKDNLNTLIYDWDHLLFISSRNKVELEQTLELIIFSKDISEFSRWVIESKNCFASYGHGSDVSEVTRIQKILSFQDHDINNHGLVIALLDQRLNIISENLNYYKQDAIDMFTKIKHDYDDLVMLLEERKSRLCQSAELIDIQREISDEQNWIDEKLSLMHSMDFGEDIFSVEKSFKKQQMLMAEFLSRNHHLEAVFQKGQLMIDEGHYSKSEIKLICNQIELNWNELRKFADNRLVLLEGDLFKRQYLSQANEAGIWLREKGAQMTRDDIGKDEDSAARLISKQQTLLSDVSLFAETLSELREHSKHFKDSINHEDNSSTFKEYVKAVYDFHGLRSQELSLKKGQIASILSTNNKDWWKLERITDGKIGYIPVNYLEKVFLANKDFYRSYHHQNSSVNTAQVNLEVFHQSVLVSGNLKLSHLKFLQECYVISREVGELETWIGECILLQSTFEFNESINSYEEFEDINTRFDDLFTEIWSFESRILSMIDIKEKYLLSNPYSNETNIFKIDRMYKDWYILLESMNKKKSNMIEYNVIMKYLTDIEETISWILDKDHIASSEALGKDLSSAHILYRNHQRLMSTMTAIKEKVESLLLELNPLANKQITFSHFINSKLNELSHSWHDLTVNAAARHSQLNSSIDFHKFLKDHLDFVIWYNSIQGLVSFSNELSNDVNGVDALIQRHAEIRTDLDSKHLTSRIFMNFGLNLIEDNHFASDEINNRLMKIENSWTELINLWELTETRLNDSFKIQLFIREFEKVKGLLLVKNFNLKQIEIIPTLDGIQNLLKYMDEFDKSFSHQDNRINNILFSADSLTELRHFASYDIANMKADVLHIWSNLKTQIINIKCELRELYSFQKFSVESDEFDFWLREKLVISNIKMQNHIDLDIIDISFQKHQELQAEVVSFQNRLTDNVNAGQMLIESGQNMDKQFNISSRIKNLEESFHLLLSSIESRTSEFNEVHLQQILSLEVKDYFLWLEDTKIKLFCDEFLMDIEKNYFHFQKYNLILADIKGHKIILDELTSRCDKQKENENVDKRYISSNCKRLINGFTEIESLAIIKEKRLNENKIISHFCLNIDLEESWLKEKTLLSSVEDFGRDLIGFQRIQKNHDHFSFEIHSHELSLTKLATIYQQILTFLKLGNYQKEIQSEISLKFDKIMKIFEELKRQTEFRKQDLIKAEEYHLFSTSLSEEESWLNEKKNYISFVDTVETLTSIQTFLSRHESFFTDLQIHRRLILDLVTKGQTLITQGSTQSENIYSKSNKLLSNLENTEIYYDTNKKKLIQSKDYFIFLRRLDLIESWIIQKDNDVRSSDYGDGRILSLIECLISKHNTFDLSLQAFEIEAINPLELEMKNILSNILPYDKKALQKHIEIKKRFENLIQDSNNRSFRLNRAAIQSRKLNDLFLQFASKASSFSSWVENAEEDLTESTKCNSLGEIKIMKENYLQFQISLTFAQGEFQHLGALDQQIKSFTPAENPYTWHSIDSILEIWAHLERIIKQRETDISSEFKRQEMNDKLKRLFASKANSFYSWLIDCRKFMIQGNGELQLQLKSIQLLNSKISERYQDLKYIQQIYSQLEELIILDNTYSEHTPVILTHQWEQLSQLNRRIQHNIQLQIQTKYITGVSDDDLKEWKSMFYYFDKDETNKLNDVEFKSCLRSLGFSLAVLEEGEKDPLYESILNQVDNHRLGYVSHEQFMSFMIGQTTEHVQSRKDLEEAFKAISKGGNNFYVTEKDLSLVLNSELTNFCSINMKPYFTHQGNIIPMALDYIEFTRSLFLS